MSMREYPVMLDAAFIIDQEVAAYISLSCDKEKDCVPEAIKALSWEEFVKMARAGTLPEDYDDECIGEVLSEVDCVSCFDGDIVSLFPDRTPDPLDESTEDDDATIYYVPSRKSTELFEAAYGSPEDLLNEFKELFSEYEIEFPEDFDWWKRLVKIMGTTFG